LNISSDHHHGHDVGERLYLHRHSVVHQIPPHIKILAGLLFIVVAVSTDITNWPAFVAYFAIIITITQIAKLPIITVFKRSLIEVPFVLFALLMPFFGTGEVVEVGSLNLYVDGLLAGASIVVKGTLGILVAINLSATTTAREILNGLEILKMPTPMVQIASFMLRYVNVVNDEMLRMAVARASRGFEATGVRQWPVLATAAGALFIRSYERGERVHLAMIARGYQGDLPKTEKINNSARYWAIGLAVPFIALIISLLSRWVG
jgi:cobalt/nickel transport system permease protein